MDHGLRGRFGSRTALLCVAACWLAAAARVRPQAGAEAPKQAVKVPQYEVVSIKPHKSDDNGGWWELPNGFRVLNMHMADLIRGAYGVFMESQVVGMPEWAETESYDIEAKVDEETAEEWEKLSAKERWKQEQPMQQSLLADRCRLKAHLETRELPIYELVVAKGGLKMKDAPADEIPSEQLIGAGRMTAGAMPAETLAFVIQHEVGRVIVDKTGLADRKFDFELKWTPENQRNGLDAADAGPSIFTALEEQLGLKLVPAKGPVQVLVIDHIERPSPN